MNKLRVGLVGYGNVGSGVVQFLKKQRNYIKDKFQTEIIVQVICSRSIAKKAPAGFEKSQLTTNYKDVINNPDIDVVVELIGGVSPAKDLVAGALKKGKHVVTANKALIANAGKELFELARKNNVNLYFESAVGAGIPVIKTISEGVAGNKFQNVYGIVNGTCNFILSEMSRLNCSFKSALEDAQKKGFAEPDPTLDINGMDSAHKLAILIALAFGKYVNVKDIHTEGITDVALTDIEHAESLGLTIKLLAIAKKTANNQIEARVHPTFISKEHPLASINGIFNAIFLESTPLGHILLSGEGAGQMTAASGVVTDLINLAVKNEKDPSVLLSNLTSEDKKVAIKKIDEIKTKFYIRCVVTDKPGVLSKITGILGDHGISINSFTQKAHDKMANVPVVMLTDFTTEKQLRTALSEIHKLNVAKGKPVAIRMENLYEMENIP